MFSVELCGDKTKLLAIPSKGSEDFLFVSKLLNPIKIDGIPIEFSTTAEHVGIIRSEDGNLPQILQRIKSHKRALGSTLAAGLASQHRANPVASIKVHQTYALPKLMSGLAPLVLSSVEKNTVDHHVKITLERLQKFHQNTPTPFVMFMGGTLPGLAILHQRQLSLFGMICRLPDNILFDIAKERFSSASTNPGSWFTEIRMLCLKYRLPHPFDLLHYGHTKDAFKKMVKSHIIIFWEQKL